MRYRPLGALQTPVGLTGPYGPYSFLVLLWHAQLACGFFAELVVTARMIGSGVGESVSQLVALYVDNGPHRECTGTAITAGHQSLR